MSMQMKHMPLPPVTFLPHSRSAILRLSSMRGVMLCSLMSRKTRCTFLGLCDEAVGV